MRKMLTMTSGLVLAALAAGAAQAQVKIGITLSATGPAAALGVPKSNIYALLPREIAGQKVEIIVLDDASDPGRATTNARRLITDDKVDVLIGSSVTPVSNAVANVAFETRVLHLATSPIAVPADRRQFTFVMPQAVPLIAEVLFDHMAKNNVKTLGMVGFSDSWGDLWVAQYRALGEKRGIKLVADERYGRADTSVTGQALKLIAARPDAVLVAASGTAAALPNLALRERGYRGTICQTHGAVSPVFMKIGGASTEGTILASGPAAVADLLASGAPTKSEGEAFIKLYEGKHGAGSRNQFAGHAYDAFAVLRRIVPAAMKTAKPGTPEFRAALRAAIVQEKEIVASHGVYNFTESDHDGLDHRARVLLVVKDGKFALLQ
ncbi:MAG: ABC transporter substrate-binding protein [Alphaproteobacteria bacterium]|nr:ABC transporter substrate-binding protein [Alphaproteobacteria bacterium]